MWTIAGVRSVVTAPEGIDLVIVVVKTSIEDRVQLVAAGGYGAFRCSVRYRSSRAHISSYAHDMLVSWYCRRRNSRAGVPSARVGSLPHRAIGVDEDDELNSGREVSFGPRALRRQRFRLRLCPQ